MSEPRLRAASDVVANLGVVTRAAIEFEQAYLDVLTVTVLAALDLVAIARAFDVPLWLLTDEVPERRLRRLTGFNPEAPAHSAMHTAYRAKTRRRNRRRRR